MRLVFVPRISQAQGKWLVKSPTAKGESVEQLCGRHAVLDFAFGSRRSHNCVSALRRQPNIKSLTSKDEIPNKRLAALFAYNLKW
jgi:hypothetical protein